MSESNVTVIDFPEKSFTFNGNDYYDQDYWGTQQYTWTNPSNGYTWKPRWSTVKRQYKISGLRPNSKYDFYVNGVRRNNCVGQANLEAYEQNKADTSLESIRSKYPYNGWYWGWWGWWGGWWWGWAWWGGWWGGWWGWHGNSNWKYLDYMLTTGDATNNDPMISDSNGVVDFNFFSGLFAQQVHDHPGDPDVAKEYVEEALQELREDYGMQVTDQQFNQIVQGHKNSVDWWQSHNWWWWKGWWEMWWTMRGLSKMELVGPDVIFLPPPPEIVPTTISTRSEIIRIEKTTYEHEYAPDQLASEVSLYFDWIQTFYLDSQLFESSTTATIYSINLYFLTRPGRLATSNVSGIDNPGCHIYICETQGGTPDLTKTYRTSIAKLAYDQIYTSGDASLPTSFVFTHPLTLDTNKTYGIVVNFEDPNYVLATAKSGQPLIDDPNSTYSSDYAEGKLYRASNYGEIDNDPDTLDELYKPLNSSDMKFDMSFCKFDTDNTYTLELVNDDYEFIEIQEFPLDYLDRTFSIQDVVYVDYGNPSANVFYSTGERYDYSQPIIVPQRLSSFSASSGLTSILNQDGSVTYVESNIDENQNTGESLAPSRMEHGFVYNEAQKARSANKAAALKDRMLKCENRIKIQKALAEANPADKFNLFKDARKLAFCIGSSIEPLQDNYDEISSERLTQTFMNIRLAQAINRNFYTTVQSNGELIEEQEVYVTPVWAGIVENIDYSSNTVTVLSQNQQYPIGINGIADIEWVQTTPISTNYNNIFQVIFSQSGAESATVSLQLDSSGNITALNIINAGRNFDSNAAIQAQWKTVQVNNYGFESNFGNGNNISTPPGITLTPVVGAYLVSSMTGVRTLITGLRNISVDNVLPQMDIQVRNAEVSNLYINYSIVQDEANEKYTLSDSNELIIENQVPLDINTYDAYVLSRTNELKTFDTLGSTTSEGKSSLVKFSIRTQNPWESPELIQSLSSVYTFENVVNNDATLEESPYYGLANAKHISKQITFDKDRFAEDIRVISTMWKPLGTDVKMYAKIHNSSDEQAYEEKGWTLLEIKDKTLGKEYSSKLNKLDTVEFTYGFKLYPELNQTIVGAEESFAIESNAAKGNANTTIRLTGNYTSLLSNNQVLVLYHPEFADGQSDILVQQGQSGNPVYQVIKVANTPYYDATDTLFEIDQDIANDSILTLADYGILASVKNPYAAFIDSQDGNVVKYYTSEGEAFSTYDTMSIKVVMLAETNHVVPQIEDIRAIAVSA